MDNTIMLKANIIDLYDEGSTSREPFIENDNVNWNFAICDKAIEDAIIERADLKEALNENIQLAKEHEDCEFPTTDMYLCVSADKAVSIDVTLKLNNEEEIGGTVYLDDIENEAALIEVDKFLFEHGLNTLDDYIQEVNDLKNELAEE